MSTQLIKPNYLVILPPTQHHSFFRNLPPFFLDTVPSGLLVAVVSLHTVPLFHFRNGLICMFIFTPLHETNTQARRIHTIHFASLVIQHTWKLQLSLVVRCDGEVITFPARFQYHPIKLYIEISKAIFNY